MKNQDETSPGAISRKHFLQRVGATGAGLALGGALNRADAAPGDLPGATHLAAPRPKEAPNSGHQVDVRDFGARGDGQTDDTPAFAAALARVGQSGLGGTVSVPLGNYLLSGSITIPAYVTLEGIWSAPAAGSQNKGTTLLVTGGRGQEDGTPFITLGANATLKGLTIFYPEQKAEDIVPYPWCVRGAGGDNMTILDCLLVNPYQAIDFATHPSGRHYIRNVQGQPLKRGLFIDKCLDIGRVENVHFWPFWTWDETSGIREWLWRNGTAFQFARNDWGYVLNTFAFGYNVGYRFVRSVNTGADSVFNGPMNGSLIGIAADACHTPLQIDATSNPGLLISNGQFVSIDFRFYAGQGGAWRDDPQAVANPPRGLITATDFDGIVQLQNCTFFGLMENTAQISGGVVSFNNCSFKDWDRGRAGSPAFDVRGGTLLINGCLFNSAGMQLRARDQTQSVVFVGNRLMDLLQIDNPAHADVQSGFNVAPLPMENVRLSRRFFSGFEPGQPRALSNVADDGKEVQKTDGAGDGVGVTNVSSLVRPGAGRKGGSAMVLAGRRAQTGHVYVYRRAFNVDLPVRPDTVLRYWMRSSDSASTHGGIDLLLDNNTFLRDVPAMSTNGVEMHPAMAKGTVGKWTPVESRIGRWLQGRTIKAILVAHDSDGGIGPFETAFDDIEIGEPATAVGQPK